MTPMMQIHITYFEGSLMKVTSFTYSLLRVFPNTNVVSFIRKKLHLNYGSCCVQFVLLYCYHAKALSFNIVCPTEDSSKLFVKSIQ